jgi:hypothetical protein
MTDRIHDNDWELTDNRTVPQVMVISSEGMFQAYTIDLENGGECSLMKEFS